MNAYAIVVRGTPAPQGSKRALPAGGRPGGRPVIVEMSKAAGPWRQAVRSETQRVIPAPLIGPVWVTIEFQLQRPRSAPKSVIRPIKRPDLDKLARAVLDGLTMGGAWLDDAQVISLLTTKVFAETAPGCTITVADYG